MKKLKINDITSYNINWKRSRWDYSYWWWYLIKNIKEWKLYIWKSKDVLNRLKSHIYNSRKNKWILVDRAMFNNLDNFEFFIIAKYTDFWVNFFTRKLETKIEYKYIADFKSYFPYWYNQKYYEYI